MLRLGWRLVLAMLQWMGLFSWWIYSILVIFYFLGSNDFTMLVLLEFWWAIHSFSGELFNRSFVNFVCSFFSTSWFQWERKYLCCWTIFNELIHTAVNLTTTSHKCVFVFGLIMDICTEYCNQIRMGYTIRKFLNQWDRDAWLHFGESGIVYSNFCWYCIGC